MDLSLKIGIVGEAKTVVSEKNTAVAYGSGSVPVFATPAMIALMESAAISSVQGCLPDGHTTVGTMISSSHLAASPLGVEIVAKSELIEIAGKRLVFKVVAFDSKGKIGEGTHERFIINEAKFLQKTEEKKI
ncbi:MAG: thioesterase family protein [Thermincola sp.]|nr:thioesterase family protein [Thermincola sp.]MDT3702150.1 thioesterase family protein [Thermincola sp.]